MVDPTDIKIRGKTDWHSLKGNQGPEGPPGPPLNIKDSVTDDTALHALPKAGNTKGDARIVEKTGDLYVWDGTKWVKTSHLKGDDGKEGKPGRSVHTFEKKKADLPPVASKPEDPATEPDNIHVGDIWIELPDSP